MAKINPLSTGMQGGGQQGGLSAGGGGGGGWACAVCIPRRTRRMSAVSIRDNEIFFTSLAVNSRFYG